MEPIKRFARVTIEKYIEVEFPPEFFNGMTIDEYLAEFRKGLWPVESFDDVVKYAARVAAMDGAGQQHDGLGYVDYSHATYPRVPDVKFRVISDDCEEEIIGGAA